MILADSSVWIDHLRRPDPGLIALLEQNLLLGHPFVTGEIALGSIATRAQVIAKLEQLPPLRVAHPAQVAMLIEGHRLWGCGIGYVDAHLLAAVLLSSGALLWTRDKQLHAQAQRLGVAH